MTDRNRTDSTKKTVIDGDDLAAALTDAKVGSLIDDACSFGASLAASGRDDTTSREALLDTLRALSPWGQSEDPGREHLVADRALLDYIGDPEITEAFDAIHKWYS